MKTRVHFFRIRVQTMYNVDRQVVGGLYLLFLSQVHLVKSYNIAGSEEITVANETHRHMILHSQCQIQFRICAEKEKNGIWIIYLKRNWSSCYCCQCSFVIFALSFVWCGNLQQKKESKRRETKLVIDRCLTI